MENKIPTAEEYRSKMIPKLDWDLLDKQYLDQCFIEFAKLHVEAALKAAYEKGQIYDYIIDMPPIGNSILKSKRIDKNSILNSYPLDNIK